jgi:hypothetical protein
MLTFADAEQTAMGETHAAVEKLMQAMDLCKGVGDLKGEARCLRYIYIYVCMFEVYIY